jgi:hypothetical protein
MLRGDQDGEFVQPVIQRSLEADIFADLLQPVREFGLRSQALKGPLIDLRGPLMIASATFFCAGFICSIGICGMCSCP